MKPTIALYTPTYGWIELNKSWIWKLKPHRYVSGWTEVHWARGIGPTHVDLVSTSRELLESMLDMKCS